MKDAIYAAKVYLITFVSSIVVMLLLLWLYALLSNVICTSSIFGWSLGWYCHMTFFQMLLITILFLGVLKEAYNLTLKYLPKNTNNLIINGKPVEEKQVTKPQTSEK